LGRIDHADKFGVAYQLLVAWNFGLSTQILSEFYVNAQRKSERPLLPSEAAEWVRELDVRPCVHFDPPLVFSAIELSQRYRIHFWDAAIIAAAERLESPILYTEDLNHGQVYGSVRVINPFREAPA
jgi:predicted nucleic acid-binding protein